MGSLSFEGKGGKKYDVDPALLKDGEHELREVTVDGADAATNPLPAGTILGQLGSPGSKGKFTDYDSGDADGSEDPVYAVVLAHDLNHGGSDAKAMVIVTGKLDQAQLSVINNSKPDFGQTQFDVAE